MADVWESIDVLLGAAVDRKGIKVDIVTDYGTKTRIYDSDAPGGGGEKSFLLPEYQVIVTDRAGDVITDYGEPQKLNLAKAAIVYGGILAASVIVIKGIKGFVS